MTDVLKQLAPYKWRGLNFPTSDFSFSLTQKLAQHEYWGVDGARLEATGRDPYVFKATIPFRNGLVPGPGETFGLLYPTEYRLFIDACNDRSDGELFHPEFGVVRCKVANVETNWKSDRRDGCDVTVTWIETLDSSLVTQALSDTQVKNPVDAILNLDAEMKNLKDKVPKLPKRALTIGDTIDGFTSVFDRATVLTKRVSGKIDAAVNKVTSIKRAVDRTKDATLWFATRECNRVKEFGDVVSNRGRLQGRIAMYVNPKAVTFASLVQTLQVDVAGLVKLNPKLVRTPLIPANTQIFYYEKS